MREKIKKNEALPGLTEIRERQEEEGLDRPKKPVQKPAPEKKTVAKPKSRDLKLKLAPEVKDQALPGLEDIRKRQLKEGLKKSTKVPGAGQESEKEMKDAAQPELEVKPLIRKLEKIETTEGEALPGLNVIRKRQLELEKEKAAPPKN